MQKDIRKKSLKKILTGTTGMTVVLVIVYFAKSHDFVPISFMIFPLAFPGAYALVGILELMTGTRFSELASRWDSLSGWQRGVLGVSIVMLMLGLVVVGLVHFASP